MKLTLTCFLVVLLLVPVVYAGDYPRHVDPASLVTVEPDPDMLFMIYHNIFEGMLLENISIQAEWFDWAGEIYSVPDLDLLLEEYGDQLLEQSINLNDTKFHLDQVVASIGEFDLETAQVSFFHGLATLQASNQSLPILEASTIRLGERLRADPEILLQDIEELGFLVDDYQVFVQVLVDYLEGDVLSGEDVDRLQDILSGVLDDEYLEIIGDILDPLQLVRTQLELEVTPESVTVGESILVSGRLSAASGGLGGKRISLSIGDREIYLVTDLDGEFSGSITVPYIYENTTWVRCFYWPRGNDVQLYSPSSDSQQIDLVFFTPEIEFQYSEAYPGLLWNVTGRLSLDGIGLEGLTVMSGINGKTGSVVTDGSGYFDVSIRIGSAADGNLSASVVSLPYQVYSGTEEQFLVEIIYYPLDFRVDVSSWVFSGAFATLDFWVESNGVPLDGCVITIRGEEDEVSYSEDGFSRVRLYTEVGRLTGTSKYWVTAEPREPWIESASLSGEFYVFNSVVIGASLVAGAAVFYLYRYRRRMAISQSEPVKPVLESIPMEVEPVTVGFSGIYTAVLRFISVLTGVNMRSSDTIREYISRVGSTLSEGLRGGFEELSFRYERWLYGPPIKVDLEGIKVLAESITERQDEE